VGFIIFLILVVLLVAIDLIVGTYFRKSSSARATARLTVGEDNNS